MRVRPRPDSSWTRHRITVVACALAITTLTGGCGFMNALAHPATPTDEVSSGPMSASGPTFASAVPVASADLVASSNGRRASLAVTASPPQRGVPPLQARNGSLGEDCHLSADATEYATLTVGFTDHGPADTKQDDEAPNLRVDVAAADGSGIGVFVEDARGIYCQGAAMMPTQTTLQTQDLAGEHQAFTVYVVARTSPATTDPLRGMTVQLRHPRRNPDVINPRSWNWNVQRVTTGRACPGDPNSLCGSLS